MQVSRQPPGFLVQTPAEVAVAQNTAQASRKVCLFVCACVSHGMHMPPSMVECMPCVMKSLAVLGVSVGNNCGLMAAYTAVLCLYQLCCAAGSSIARNLFVTCSA